MLLENTVNRESSECSRFAVFICYGGLQESLSTFLSCKGNIFFMLWEP